MLKIIDKSKCSGCCACMNVCPKKCITMKYDNEGFLYPEIDETSCVNCGLCEKMCQSEQPIISSNQPKAYACYNNDEQIRADSSSGGMFTLIATEIINRGGVVFGAGFDDEFNVRHISIKRVEDLSILRGSKYVQSTIGNSYREAETYLKDNIPVLFTGTPCQIDGLLHYLNRDYENLYTQDFICHGVPSPKVWQKYIKFRENKAGDKVKSVSLRNKKNGWQTFSTLFQFTNEAIYDKIFSEDLFMQGFLSNLYLRPSCYDCQSKTLNRNSDITLADFWGIDAVEPDMFDDKGTSLVFVNTLKGHSLFEAISNKITLKESRVTEAVAYNSAAYKSVEKPAKRSMFFKLVNIVNFDKAVKICTSKHIIYKPLSKIIKRITNY